MTISGKWTCRINKHRKSLDDLKYKWEESELSEDLPKADTYVIFLKHAQAFTLQTDMECSAEEWTICRSKECALRKHI